MINGDGIAADIQISLSIGGAVSNVLQLDASARLLFNTTGDDQPITIPAQYVDFLLGNSSVPASEDYDSSLVSGLTLTPAELSAKGFTVNGDGSATFTISGTAPGAASPGFYLLATFNANLTIALTFAIGTACAALLYSTA